MELAKRTYTLPAETLKRFEQEIAPGKRSAKVGELMEEWISERDALRQNTIEGCRDMWDVYIETAQEWESVDREADLALDR